MPHLIVEYSPNLPSYPEAEALAALNAAVCASPEVLDEADLKTRFVRAGSFEIGTAPPHAPARGGAGAAQRGNRGHGPAVLREGTAVGTQKAAAGTPPAAACVPRPARSLPHQVDRAVAGRF